MNRSNKPAAVGRKPRAKSAFGTGLAINRLRLLLCLALMACGPSLPPTDVRAWTDDFELRIRPDMVPPRALDQIPYIVIVRDKKTHEPIADGQGRIFATNADRHSISDGFLYGPEVGVYHATLMFATAGEWAMNVQFRRDSTKRLQRPDNDWRQDVDVGTEPGNTKP